MAVMQKIAPLKNYSVSCYNLTYTIAILRYIYILIIIIKYSWLRSIVQCIAINDITMDINYGTQTDSQCEYI